MAKRKVTKRKSTTRKTTSRAVSVRRKKSTSSLTPMNAVIGGVVYGAARSKIASLISPVTSKIPVVGGYADELGMGVLSYYVAKGKIKMIPKYIGLAGLMIESAVVGQDVVNGSFAGGFSSNSTQKNDGVTVR